MVEEKQESRQAEALRTLFRRIYGNVDGKRKFNLNDKQRYLTHALLQSILYELDQECSISCEIGQCINDGATACSMNTSVFVEGRSTCLRILEPDINGDFGRPEPKNPFDKQPIKEETFHFYDCAVSKIFEKDGFDAYKTQYDRAKLILMGIINIFVVKAMIAIWNFVVWFLSKENIQDFKAKCSKQFSDLDTASNPKLQSFKDYVFESEASPLKEGLMEV